MEDDYDISTSGGLDEDCGLPKATVYKLIQEMMPSDIGCAKDTKDLIAECCVEFIHLVSSEANEICEKEAKKTIAGEHVLSALKSLGFEDYIQEVQDVYNDHQKQQKDREKKSFKLENLGMTQEELIKSQEELFKQARLKLQQGSSTTPTQPQFAPSSLPTSTQEMGSTESLTSADTS